MKKIIVLVFALFAIQSFGQGPTKMFGRDPIVNLENFDKQRVHWGYFLGFNIYDFKFDYENPGQDIQVDKTTGFNVGLVGNLRLHEFIDLRFEPGLYYTQRDLNFVGFEDDPLNAKREVRSTYIHFPLLLKFSSMRTGNIRPYLTGGVSRTLNLSSNFKSRDDNTQQRFRMKQWTNNYELGFGVDLYFEYFKFSPSIRGVFGMDNEIIPDADPNSPWTGNVTSMKTRAVFINFTFH
ncbi:type IX secretion/gliding motility protein PorT/SprT [Flavobacterium selenitireducens]|uniref:type IX secretion/gliding motility protein PorT/SprT n=1 Tax=Flavobacterium selenitireducens TaxID=2722704 RepID=UPI00168A869F|nr:porin family protein [Flavobacterium selenitireducens]MBD3583160.1 PorT family protein [Flavobacterium selenitireducens]